MQRSISVAIRLKGEENDIENIWNLEHNSITNESFPNKIFNFDIIYDRNTNQKNIFENSFLNTLDKL